MNKKTKRYIYTGLFVLLGIIISFLVHASLELAIIELLLRDFTRWGLGLSWDTWFAIHHVCTVILLVVFVALCLQQGRYWWERVYEKKNK
jgi:uncharacterized membrane protein